MDPEENSIDRLPGSNDESSSDVENMRQNSNPLMFDIELPATHSYLGDDFEEVGGRYVFPELSTVKIPLLVSSYFGTLVPGQIFPFTATDHEKISLMRHCVAGNHTFGCISQSTNTPGTEIAVGTTAEIYECSDRTNLVIIKARGRQRFKVLKLEISPQRYPVGEVLILPEVNLRHPFSALGLTSLNGLKNFNKEKARFFESQLMYWPKWVYDMYDKDKLVERCQSLPHRRRDINSERVESLVPQDPSRLSFSLANTLDSGKKFFLISLNSPIQRLRWIWNLLTDKDCNAFNCLNCQRIICKESQCFSMSVEGAQNTYVNPEGYHHDTLTVRDICEENIRIVSRPSVAFSWFPGYAWSICVCLCSRHLGWSFEATNSQLQPKKFWGLSRHSLGTTTSSSKPYI